MKLSGVTNIRNFHVNFGKTTNNATSPVSNKANESQSSDKILRALEGEAIINKTLHGTIPTIQKQADNIIRNTEQQILKAKQDAYHTYNEVKDLFKKGNETTEDGKLLREISDTPDSLIMKEFDNSGELTRISELKKDALGREHLKVVKGIEDCDGHSQKIDKTMSFIDGTPSHYCIGYEKSPDGSEKTEMEIRLIGSMPWSYEENKEKTADGYEKMTKRMIFEDGIPAQYMEDYRESANIAREFKKGMVFSKNGEICWYGDDCKEATLGKLEAAMQYKLTDYSQPEVK